MKAVSWRIFKSGLDDGKAKTLEKGYDPCLLKTVNLGDDTDCVAAIAGGLVGLYYGYGSIPAEWLEVIQRREWVEEMCRA